MFSILNKNQKVKTKSPREQQEDALKNNLIPICPGNRKIPQLIAGIIIFYLLSSQGMNQPLETGPHRDHLL